MWGFDTAVAEPPVSAALTLQADDLLADSAGTASAPALVTGQWDAAAAVAGAVTAIVLTPGTITASTATTWASLTADYAGVTLVPPVVAADFGASVSLTAAWSALTAEPGVIGAQLAFTAQPVSSLLLGAVVNPPAVGVSFGAGLAPLTAAALAERLPPPEVSAQFAAAVVASGVFYGGRPLAEYHRLRLPLTSQARVKFSFRCRS